MPSVYTLAMIKIAHRIIEALADYIKGIIDEETESMDNFYRQFA